LDAFGFAVLKNKSWFTPTTMGAPSFKRTDPSAEEKHKYPGEWVANESNPRRVTIWRDGQMTPVIADFWDTFNNPVLPRQQPDDSDGGQEPMKIILDTDIDGDIDDVGAMAMLHAMADSGEIEILAVMVSSKHEWSAPAVDVINTYYNRPNIPIGVPKGEGRDANSRYARQLAEAFPHTLRSNSDAPDAVTLYREILSRQPDTSVVIATIGYLTNLHDLLNSKADQYSSLNGKDLVQKKVKRYICMASGVGNFRPHAEAAVNVVNNWPTLTVHTKGQDFAWSMMTGSVLQQTPSTNPVRRAYEHYFGGTAKDRHSADQLSLLIAVRGVDPHFRMTTQGYMDVGNGTRSDWSASPDNPLHHWVDWYRDGVDPAVVKNAIEKLMTQPPGAVSAFVSPDSQDAPPPTPRPEAP
jgi:inosine-uridine nucleoside N-ribohydrolase